MTTPRDPRARPPLAADDPRLSEWIDGRLSPAEAADVEQAVRSSPMLAGFVADLRAIKEAARQVPAASPPEGFVDRVMDAVVSGDTAAPATAADRAVVQEWQAIETERIAEERAEAAADQVDAAEHGIGPGGSSARRAWPWLTIAAALAAGLLVTVVLNLPREGPREIAQRAAEPEVAPELDRLAAAPRRAAAPAEAEAAPSPAAGASLPAPAAVAARSLAANARLRESQAEPAADAALPDRPVVVAVASWTEFDRLLEAHGIEAEPIEARAGDDRADESGEWTLELSGPPQRLEAFLAAAGGSGAEKPQAAADEEAERKSDFAAAPPAAKPAEEAQRDGRAPAGRLLVRLVIQQPGARTPRKSGPAAGDGGGP